MKKIIIENKKATFLYYIMDSFEAGIVLTGAEVKSIRSGKISLNGAFVSIVGLECYLKNCEISPYTMSNERIETKRERKLLLNKREILKLSKQTQEKGFTLIPTKVYFKDGRVKVEIALCKGKHTYDKKEATKERDLNRELQRELKTIKIK